MSTSSPAEESNGDGGRLNCFQLDVHFYFALKIRETSKMTQYLIAEPFALCSSAKITGLIEHLGGHSDELMSI